MKGPDAGQGPFAGVFYTLKRNSGRKLPTCTNSPYSPLACSFLRWLALIVFDAIRASCGLLADRRSVLDPPRPPGPCEHVVIPPVVSAGHLANRRGERLNLLRPGRSLSPGVHGVDAHAK